MVMVAAGCWAFGASFALGQRGPLLIVFLGFLIVFFSFLKVFFTFLIIHSLSVGSLVMSVANAPPLTG